MNPCMTKRVPELLMPAGDPQKMSFAYAYGADAVYAGVPQFSLRARENAFRDTSIEAGIAYAKERGKKFYVTANILPHNEKIYTFLKKIDQIIAWKPDAFIMADPGLISLVKEKYPQTEIHLSVQANTMNWAAARFWYQQGVSRIIMSREVSIDEIKEIKDRVPELEIEAFVHGSICIAHSGRCLLSNYFNRRDANQGTCTNACRWKYKMYAANDEVEGQYIPIEGQFYLEEVERPGELMLVDEDEYGTYVMNAKDLMAIEHLHEMWDAGVDSFKVEGRSKSIYYLALVTRAYRQAIDNLAQGLAFDPGLLKEIKKIPHRGYTSGFLTQTYTHENQRYQGGTDSSQEFAAFILKSEDQGILIEPRNRLALGDEIEIIQPGQSSFQLKISNLRDLKGNELEAVHGGAGVQAWIPCSKKIDSEFAIASKVLRADDQYVKPSIEVISA